MQGQILGVLIVSKLTDWTSYHRVRLMLDIQLFTCRNKQVLGEIQKDKGVSTLRQVRADNELCSQ